MTAINPTTEDALSVVMVQFAPVPAEDRSGIDQNIKTICDYVDRAVFSWPGVDIVVFPEYSTQGFGYKYLPHLEYASTIPGPETDVFSKKAQEHGVWLCVHCMEKNEDPTKFPYNAQVLIDSKGDIALKYRKMNPWCPKEPWTPGNEISVCEGPKGAKFSIILCYDGDLPEPSREATWKGANIIIRPSKYMYPWNDLWEVTNRCRAVENLVYVLAPNTGGEDPSFSYFGRTMAVDYNGYIMTQMGSNQGMTKTDLFPKVVDELHRTAQSHNNLINLKHRAYTGVPPDGVLECPYSIYRDWDKIPEKWARIPESSVEIARVQRDLLVEFNKSKNR